MGTLDLTAYDRPPITYADASLHSHGVKQVEFTWPWCRQGCYEPGEITILTPYAGQLLVLQRATDACTVEVTTIVSEQQQQQQQQQRKGKHKVKQPLMSRQRKQLSGLVRMATVDNFQGELQSRFLVQ